MIFERIIRFKILFDRFQFEKPGRRDDFDYPDMAKEAVSNAVKDAGVSFKDFEQAFVGYVYGRDSFDDEISFSTIF